MTKIAQRITAAVFCLFLAGFGLAHLLLPDRDFSPVENRSLEGLPAFSWSALAEGSYTADLEKYLADQFPLRDGWMGLKNRMEYLLGRREFHGVYLCGDTLINKVEEAGRADQNLDCLRRLAEMTDLPVYTALIPTAAEIWRSKLPRGAESFDQRAYLERARALPGLHWVDVGGALADHAGEPIFYRTDHHWTTLGAYYGYAALMEALGRGEEALGQETFERLTVPHSDAFQGTLYSQSGIHWLPPDSIEFWVPDEGFEVASWRDGSPKKAALYDLAKLQTKDKYSAFLGGNQPLCVIKNPEGTGKLLVIRDSYADSMAPFLALHFEEVHLLDPRYYRYSAAKYAEENGLDAIAVVYSVPNFITDRNLVLLIQ